MINLNLSHKCTFCLSTNTITVVLLSYLANFQKKTLIKTIVGQGEKDHLLEIHLLEKSARHQNLDCSTPSLEHVRHRLGQVRLGQVGQVRLGQVRLGQVRLGQVRLGQGRLGQVIGHVRLGQVFKSFCVSSRCHFSCRAVDKLSSSRDLSSCNSSS